MRWDMFCFVLLRKKRLHQSCFPHFAVADEHQPQLVHAPVRTSAQILKDGKPTTLTRLIDDFVGRNDKASLKPENTADALIW